MPRVAAFAAAVAAAFAAVLATATSTDAGGRKLRTAGPAYTVVDLGTLGGTTSFATAVNRSGAVVGYSEIAGDAATHAFLWRRGVMTDLGTLPGGISSRANAINDRGQIVGSSDALTPSSFGYDIVAPQAFLYSRGKLVDIDPNTSLSYTPGSRAYGINAAGQVVGNVLAPSGDSLAFLYGGGSFAALPVSGMEPEARAIDDRGQIVGSTDSDLSPPFIFAGGVQTNFSSARGQATAINERGEVTGWTQQAGAPVRAFMSAGGALTSLGTLGGPTSQANAIDNHGRAVGTADVASGVARAFLYRTGAMLDLNKLIPPSSGWLLENATGITDGGEIVGAGTVQGAEHAFLLVPNGRHARANR